MVAEITVNNSDEFQELVDQKDFRISKAIVEGIELIFDVALQAVT